jgi:hypothetical protein
MVGSSDSISTFCSERACVASATIFCASSCGIISGVESILSARNAFLCLRKSTAIAWIGAPSRVARVSSPNGILIQRQPSGY